MVLFQNTTLILTGDPVAFANFWTSPTPELSLKVVPIPCDSDLGLTGVPGNITVNSTSSTGATVGYTPPTATDEPGDNPGPTLACNPPPGSRFLIGTTTVTCTATDGDDTNSGVHATFAVTVVVGPLDRLVLTPASATISAGQSQTYTARGADRYGNDLGDMTAATIFTINSGGTCTANGCTGSPGTYTVTGMTGSPAKTGTSTLTISKLATTTAVAIGPANPTFGSPVTFTASVTPSVPSPLKPTGSVRFYLSGSVTPAATVTLNGNTAPFTTSGLGAGSHTVKAIYSGDTNFSASSGVLTTGALSCSRTVSGTSDGTLVLGSGSTCIVNAQVNGGITVQDGSSLDVENSTVTGSVVANNPGSIRACGSTMGAVNVNGATGFVVVGDVTDGCAVNTINGSLVLRNNTGGVQAIGNHVAGTVVAANNSGTGPFPDDTAVNISGNGH